MARSAASGTAASRKTRKPAPVKPRGSYRTKDPAYEARIQACLARVRDGVHPSLRQASIIEKIPFSTLQARASGKHNSSQAARGARQLLQPSQEAAVLDWARHNAQSGRPFSATTLRQAAAAVSGKTPGRTWVRGFFQRHRKKIIKSKGSKLDPKRSQNFNKATIKHYFGILGAVDKEYGGLIPEQTWNMDEKGIQMGGGRHNNPTKFFYDRETSSDNRYRISSDNLELVTVIECISAAGESMPVSFVVKGDPPDVSDIEEGKIGSVGSSETGWTDNEHGAYWLREVFIPNALDKCKDKSKPIVLIYDGHESHETLDIEDAVYNVSDVDIIIICLPSKTTHKTQPLDVVVFSRVQRRWTAHADDCTFRNNEITKSNVIHEYLAMREDAVSPELIRKAFEKTGIYPLNPNVFGEDDFAPSMASSCQAHVPASYPPQMLSSDAVAIPSDVEMSDSEMSNDDMDEDFRPSSPLPPSSDFDMPLHIEEEGYVDLEPNPPLLREETQPDAAPQSNTNSVTIPVTRSSSSASTLINSPAEELLHPPPIIPYCEDEILDFDDRLETVRHLRDQLTDFYDGAVFWRSQYLAAQAHCTLLRRELEMLRVQLMNEKNKKRRNTAKMKCRLFTHPSLNAVYQTRRDDAETRRVEDERQQAQKNADEIARKQRLAHEVVLRVFDTPLTMSNYKRDDLIALAGALGIDDTGIKQQLMDRIKAHLNAKREELSSNPRFSELFAQPQRGRRREALAPIANTVALTSNQYAAGPDNRQPPAPPTSDNPPNLHFSSENRNPYNCDTQPLNHGYHHQQPTRVNAIPSTSQPFNPGFQLNLNGIPPYSSTHTYNYTFYNTNTQ
ncbi:hypothetical protein EST38_g5483 [Candolleomyces aberdarensis]|uniref:HTH CENPB-type domain-containing protein n=1 Tax=Candolleomyces aberdarensis TaxID=2316362 RepID=A0A4Q2DKG5_9AGAR|nr:hypothetical protein EST38_g5483 [Candolleomyces aberdarensis]